jgi:hypothetical protein
MEFGTKTNAEDHAALGIGAPPTTLREIALRGMPRAIIVASLSLEISSYSAAFCDLPGVSRAVIREVNALQSTAVADWPDR